MKKPVVLLLILAALTAFALIYDKGLGKRINSARLVGADTREFLIPNLPADKIRHLRVRDGEKQVNVVISGDQWTVAERSGYPASFDKVKRSVQALADMKIKGKNVIGKSVLPEVKLLAHGEGDPARAGLQIDLLDDKGGSVATLIAGDTVSSSGGASSGNWMGGPGEQRYVRIPADNDTVWLIGDSFYELAAEPKDWLDKAFVNVEKIKSAEFTAPNAADSWKAERKDEGSPFAHAGGAAGDELDTAKADGLNSLMANALFEDVVPKDKAGADFMKGAVKARLVTFDGFTYDIEVLEKKEGKDDSDAKHYLTVKVAADLAKERKPVEGEKEEDKKKADEEFAAKKKTLEEKLAKGKALEGWTYEVSSYTVSAALKKRSEVLREKPAAPPAPEPAPPTPPPAPPAAAPASAPPPPASAPAPEAPAPAPAKPADQ